MWTVTFRCRNFIGTTIDLEIRGRRRQALSTHGSRWSYFVTTTVGCVASGTARGGVFAVMIAATIMMAALPAYEAIVIASAIAIVSKVRRHFSVGGSRSVVVFAAIFPHFVVDIVVEALDRTRSL